MSKWSLRSRFTCRVFGSRGYSHIPVSRMRCPWHVQPLRVFDTLYIVYGKERSCFTRSLAHSMIITVTTRSMCISLCPDFQGHWYIVAWARRTSANQSEISLLTSILPPESCHSSETKRNACFSNTYILGDTWSLIYLLRVASWSETIMCMSKHWQLAWTESNTWVGPICYCLVTFRWWTSCMMVLPEVNR